MLTRENLKVNDWLLITSIIEPDWNRLVMITKIEKKLIGVSTSDTFIHVAESIQHLPFIISEKRIIRKATKIDRLLYG